MNKLMIEVKYVRNLNNNEVLEESRDVLDVQYVQEPASNKKRLCHYIANCDTMTFPRNKPVVKVVCYTDVKN